LGRTTPEITLKGYHFSDPSLLKRALIHSSYAEERGGGRVNSNERMEFLGDAILGFLVGKIIFTMFPDADEGFLSRLKAYWVSTGVVAGMAESAGIKGALLLGAGEKKSGGADNPRILAGAVESVIAAVYLDGGLKAAEKLVSALWKGEIREVGEGPLLLDFKTRLQESLQKEHKEAPRYDTEKLGREFVSTVLFREEPIGEGRGTSKKKAEQEAAKAAIERLHTKERKER